MNRGLRRAGDFTLLELLVALAIMALSLGMLYRASGSGARNVGDIERQQQAVALAESLLSLRDAVPEEGWNQAGASAGFDWRVASAPFATAINSPNVPPLHEISIVVSWRDGGRLRELVLHTLRPQRKPPEPGRRP